MIKREPLRTCIACREEKPKKEMLRVVKNAAGEIQVDLKGKAEGRGAYVCLEPACLAKLKKSRLLNRAFSCEVPPEVYDRIFEVLSAKK